MLVEPLVREADEILRELLGGREMQADPYPLYHRLRDVAVVHRSDLDGAWYVSGYDACREVLLDPRVGKSPEGRATRFGVNEEQIRRLAKRRRPSMITANPPEHSRLRTPARGPFMPGMMEQLRSRVEAVVDERLDVVADKGDADVMADVAFQLPVTVIGELVGVPRSDREQFPPLVHEFFAASRPGATAEQMDRADRAAERLRRYFSGLVDHRRSHPGDDLIGQLVAAQANGAVLSDDELHGTITLIFVAGFITTANLIGNGLLALLRSPGEFDRLWADGTLVPSAVEEMLRYDPPVQMVERQALDDVHLGDETIPAGATIVPLLAAANRDPQRFADPDRLDVGRRDGNGHVSFAWGIHHCLGAPLARLEGRLVFARLRDRFRRLELLDPDPPRRPGLGFRSLVRLPVRFTAR
jgi:cytochrome P450